MCARELHKTHASAVFPRASTAFPCHLKRRTTSGPLQLRGVCEGMFVTSRPVLLARARSFLMEALGLPSRNVNLALNYRSRAGFTLQPHVEFVGKRFNLKRS